MVPSRSHPTAVVSFARVGLKDDQPPLRGAVAALEQALAPGTTVVRYDRWWRMAQHHTENGYIVGRIGFEREGQPVWNPETNDFAVGRGGGSTSRFAIDTRTFDELGVFRVVFQLRPSLITPGTFRYNFQALLNEATRWGWRVELEGVSQPPWEDWRQTVSRIVKLTIKMNRPNPHFPGDQVERLFEGAKLQAANMAMTAEPGESIRLDDPFLEQAIDLAKDHGSYKAEAERITEGKPEPTKWDSAAEGQAAKQEVSADPSTGLPPDEVLKQALSEPDDTAP